MRGPCPYSAGTDRAVGASRGSDSACRPICHAPESESSAIIEPTTRSGQPVPLANTPRAASMTATLPMASVRLQIQTERVAVAFAEQAKHHRHEQISQQREETDDAHSMRIGHSAEEYVVNRDAQNPRSEQSQGRALQQRGPCPPSQRHPGRAKADGIVGGVP